MKDLGLLILRVITGATLIAHGYTKLFGGEGRRPHASLGRLFGEGFNQAVASGGPSSFAKALESKDIPAADLAAYASGLAEFGGGLALLTGTMTRLAALVVLVNMIVAIRTMHWENGFFGQGGYEFPAQLAGGAAALLAAGPGALSVDGLFRGIAKVGKTAAGAGQAVTSALPDGDDVRKGLARVKRVAA